MTDFAAYNASTHPIVRLADDWNNLLDHGLVKSASYIIRKNSSAVYEAISGDTGLIFSSNADFHTVFNAAKAAIVGPGNIIVKGYIVCTDTLDLTNIRDTPFTIDLHQAAITASINNKPIFDFTGSHDSIRMLGGWINTGTTATTKPSVGILMARKNDSSSAGQHIIDGTVFEGYYKKAVIYNYGSEENTFSSVYARNREATSKVYWITGNNNASLSSTFQTIAAGNQSTTTNTWLGGHVLNYANDGIAVMLHPDTVNVMSAMNFYGTFIGAGTAASAIFMDMEEDGGLKNLGFYGVRITDNVPAYAFYVSDGGAARTVSSLLIKESVIQAGVKEIYVDANSTADHWDVDHTNWFPDNKGLNFNALTNSRIYHPSFKTRNRGTTTLVSGQTHIDVNHGLGAGASPQLANIRVVPTEGWGTATQFWAANIGATQFTIYTDADPGADVDFTWEIDVEP